jgi:hypothetical protein
MIAGGDTSKSLAESRRLSAHASPLISEPKTYWVTDFLLLQYQRCSRRAYLDTHRDRAEADPPSDYLQKIKQDSAAHRWAVLDDYTGFQRPEYDRGNWRSGAQATAALGMSPLRFSLPIAAVTSATGLATAMSRLSRPITSPYYRALRRPGIPICKP